MAGFFFEIGEYDAELLIWKEVERNVILDNLKAVLEILESGESFEKVEKKIMTLADERGKGNVLWPLRAALSGQKNSPGPLEIVGVLGVEESARRVTAAVEKLG
jgi:glutamyl/glutaminyl-tRNA synthetase